MPGEPRLQSEMTDAECFVGSERDGGEDGVSPLHQDQLAAVPGPVSSVPLCPLSGHNIVISEDSLETTSHLLPRLQTKNRRAGTEVIQMLEI